MADNSLMNAMFINQRIQIMHLAVHHDEYTDAYLYAWESGVYPSLSDTDGSVSKMPHEPYASNFLVSRERVDFLLKRLDNAWIHKEKITFYKLEDELKVRSMQNSDWDRPDLLHVCRYFFLANLFDDEFWGTLIKNGDCPSEALSLMRKFDRTQDIYFM